MKQHRRIAKPGAKRSRPPKDDLTFVCQIRGNFDVYTNKTKSKMMLYSEDFKVFIIPEEK
jgi:hypothetical protein